MIKSENSFSKYTQKCHQIEEGEPNGNFVQNDTLFVNVDEDQVKTETIESLTEVKSVHVENGGEGWLRCVLDAFNWDDFFYALLMGLLPCVLDISTDFRFAIILDVNEKNSTAAGLAYAIIIMPGIDFASYFIFQKVWDNVGDSLWARGPVLFLFTAGIGLLLGGLLWSIVHSPTSLFYPAVVSAALLLAIKLMALVIHTTDMKRVSAMASSSEGNFEAAYQLLLMLLTWLTGGGVHILSIAASVLVIGKTRSERHLSLQPDLKMHEKTFERKVLLVAAHTPIFSLAAIFRIGSLALISGCLPATPTSVDSFIKFQVTFFCFQVAVFSLMPLLIRGVSRCCPPLGQLTALEACQGVLGEWCAACTFFLNLFISQARSRRCLSGQA